MPWKFVFSVVCINWIRAHFFLFIRAILVSKKWYLIMFLICISLMTKDFEHLFTCLLAIRIASLENYLFKFFFLVINCCLSFCISLMYNDVEHLFMHCVYVLWRNGYSSLSLIFYLSCLSFCCWVVGALYISWIVDHHQVYNLQIFSPML